MSMYQIEDIVEIAVDKIAVSDLPVLRKRSLIRVAFEMESYGDCSFTNLRTIDKMVECGYTFLFNKEEMFDYAARKEYYDSLETATPEADGVYAYRSKAYPEKDGMVCVDSGSAAWKEMVSRGFITGDGAVELEEIGFLDALKQIAPLVFDKTDEELQRVEKEFCTLSIGLYMLVAFTVGTDELDEKDCIEIFGMNQEALEAKLEAYLY